LQFPRCYPRNNEDGREHTHHDNGEAARDWNVLSIRPPLRGASAFAEIPFERVGRHGTARDEKKGNR